MDIETKAKLANRLTHALHQAPNHPEVFTTVLGQTIRTAGLHITDLAITFGDLTNRMAERLREAQTDAQPTFQNLLDLAGTKVNLGRKPERVMAQVLGVPVRTVEDCKRGGKVPRNWFNKIRAMPELDETRVQFDSEIEGAVRVLAEKGYTPEAIHAVFLRMRTSRPGLTQIAKIVYGQDGQLDSEQLNQMQRELFGEGSDASRRFHIWAATHLRSRSDMVTMTKPQPNLSAGQVERLRDRFKRELRLRQSDVSYRAVASAAELIERPLKANSRIGRVDPIAESRRLRSRLDRLFGNHRPELHSARLSQLTGLDERHTSDLLKGANGVGQVWWNFLDEVEAQVLPSDEAPLLRRMGEGQIAEGRFGINGR